MPTMPPPTTTTSYLLMEPRLDMDGVSRVGALISDSLTPRDLIFGALTMLTQLLIECGVRMSKNSARSAGPFMAFDRVSQQNSAAIGRAATLRQVRL